MKQNQIREIINKLNLKCDELKKEMLEFDFKEEIDIDLYVPDESFFSNPDDYKRYSYIHGKRDFLRSISETVLESTCFDDHGDLYDIKKMHPETYSYFLDGYSDGLTELNFLIK